LAANAMRGADLGNADAVGHGVLRAYFFAAAAAAAASSLALVSALVLASALAASATFCFSSRTALRSLRGIARSGLLRFSRLATPAASRKRITRSDGCAPFTIQDLT